MRFLHTSDWHLGKCLERADRILEQELFLKELVQIAAEESIDMILIAGDIYDTGNPPAKAESLFYEYMTALSNNGKRPIMIVSGNHDSPGRLTAPNPLLRDMGIFIIGPKDSSPEPGNYGSCTILRSGPHFVEMAYLQEKIVLTFMPYPSERNLNLLISGHQSEALYQLDYSEKIGSLLKEAADNFRADTINITMGHFYVAGGEESGSERKIQLGGSMAVSPAMLPKNAHYTALGHLHRPQQISGGPENAYYSGSPIQYSKSETGYSKCVYIVDISPGETAAVHKRYLKNYKPIEILKATGIEQALSLCQEKSHENSWVFLEITTDRVLTMQEIAALRSTKKDILDIMVILPDSTEQIMDEFVEKSLFEDFKEFYKLSRGLYPTDDVSDLFLELCLKDESVKDET